jgi:hypothetical protein
MLHPLAQPSMTALIYIAPTSKIPPLIRYAKKNSPP